MSRRGRGNSSVADQLVREGRTARRPDPFLVVWRWRWELALVGAVVLLMHAVAPAVLLPVTAVAVAFWAAVPVLRRLARDRFWCVATQHRLRAGLHESDVRSWSGRAPAIVWTSAVDGGERVLLACPAGVDVARIAVAHSELAAACWARDVAVAPHHRYANLAVVEVVRRGPRRGSS